MVNSVASTPISNLQSQIPKKSHSTITADWWTPMWRGLVVDTSAKHYRTMSKAVWLYLYLLLFANRQTGIVRRKLETIAVHTGIKPRTLQRYLSMLRQAGYVDVENTGHSLTITIQKWKPLGRRVSSSTHWNQAQNTTSLKPRTTEPGGFRHKFQKPLFLPLSH